MQMRIGVDIKMTWHKDDFTSIGAYIVYLGQNPIFWSSKKQVEYRSVANTTAEISWIYFLLSELHIKILNWFNSDIGSCS